MAITVAPAALSVTMVLCVLAAHASAVLLLPLLLISTLMPTTAALVAMFAQVNRLAPRAHASVMELIRLASITLQIITTAVTAPTHAPMG